LKVVSITPARPEPNALAIARAVSLAWPVASCLGGHHDDVHSLWGLDLPEVDVEPVGELEGLPGLEGQGDLLAVDRGLSHVGDEHQYDVGFGGGIKHRLYLHALGLRPIP
jgi:hypothetical protein